MANTKDLIDAIAPELTQLTKKDIESVVEAFLTKAADFLQEGQEVTLRNFGRLFTHTRGARTGHNPKTGEKIQIEEKTVVKFKGRGDLAQVAA